MYSPMFFASVRPRYVTSHAVVVCADRRTAAATTITSSRSRFIRRPYSAAPYSPALHYNSRWMRDDRPARDGRFSLTSILLLALACALAPAVSGQEQTFKARLSSVPISADMAALITGSGSVTGTLSGHTLTVTG